VPVRAARAEFRWLSGQLREAAVEAGSGYGKGVDHVDPWTLGSVAIWLSRLGEPLEAPPDLPEPYGLEIAGDWARAAAAWHRLDRPYDAALAWLNSSDEAGLREALGILDELGPGRRPPPSGDG